MIVESPANLDTCSKCGEVFFNAGGGNRSGECYACRPITGIGGPACRATSNARVAAHAELVEAAQAQMLLEVGRVVKRGPGGLDTHGLLAQEVVTTCFDDARSIGVLGRMFGTSREAMWSVVAALEAAGLVQLELAERPRAGAGWSSRRGLTLVYARHEQAIRHFSGREEPEPELEPPPPAVLVEQPVEQRLGTCDRCGEEKPITGKSTCGACIWGAAKLKGRPMAWAKIKCDDCGKKFQRVGPGQARRVSCYECSPPKSGNVPKAPEPEPEEAEPEQEAELAQEPEEVSLPARVTNGAQVADDEPLLALAGHAILAVGARRASKWLGGWADRFEERARKVIG